MYQYFSTILYVHFRNSREGESASGVENPCAPHPLNKSPVMYENQYSQSHHLHFWAPLKSALSFGVSPTSRILAPAKSYENNEDSLMLG